MPWLYRALFEAESQQSCSTPCIVCKSGGKARKAREGAAHGVRGASKQWKQCGSPHRRHCYGPIDCDGMWISSGWHAAVVDKCCGGIGPL